MAMAADLKEAAYLSYPQASLLWTAGLAQLRTALNNFIVGASPLFEDAVANDRPVGNWLIPMKSIAAVMPGVAVPIGQLNNAVEVLYRMCYAAYINFQRNLITSDQAVALLALWNTLFGT